MDAHRIIEGAAFGPEVLKVVRSAFDDAWAAIEERFPASMHPEVRKALAIAVMSTARDNSTDTAMIRDAGVRAMQRAYQQYFAMAHCDTQTAKDR
jgi:hypothetical protein